MLGETINFKKGREYKLSVRLQNIFAKDSYTIGIRIKNSDRSENYAIFDDIREFSVDRRNKSFSWDTLLNPDKNVILEEV